MWKPSNIIIVVTALWVTIVLSLNFLIPHRWFFEYIALEATDVCRGEAQAITGQRWSLFTTPSEGVDKIVPVGLSIPADRFEWNNGLYRAGITENTWQEVIYVAPGQYQWVSDVLRLNLFYIFPVYLDDSERPVSNVFTVQNCDLQPNLNEAVAEAFQAYLEVEGYVVE